MIGSRYSGIITNMGDYTFHILGCGAIGSSAATQLVRMGGTTFFLYDMDKVEDVNIGVSQYDVKHIGVDKVKDLKSIIEDINTNTSVTPVNGMFSEYMYNGPNDIAILGFDSMKSRMEAVVILCSNSNKPAYIIDGRMGAEHYMQYVLDKPTVNKYRKVWYSDEEGDPEPCNAKATSYCSNMSGSFISNAVRKLLTKQPCSEKISFHFPTNMLVSKGNIVVN